MVNGLEQPWLVTVTSLFLVILLKYLLVRYIPHQPLLPMQIYCRLLANKVNKAENSPQQQNIAGVIASLITLLPLICILWLFENLVAILALWHALLLYFALDSMSLQRQNTLLVNKLSSKQNEQAKRLLQPYLLRKTDNLSSTGLCKAAIEMQLLRTINGLFSVSILFLLFGGLAAISFRLLLELHYSWNVKRQQFQRFGWLAKQGVELINWLPCRLFSLLLVLGQINTNALILVRAIAKDIFRLNSDLALHILALQLQCKLGGVAMYDGIKLRRIVFNDLGHQPESRDVLLANRRINQIIIFSASSLVLFTLLSMLANR
jgi:adenosylcobinamide-phosphate synthase